MTASIRTTRPKKPARTREPDATSSDRAQGEPAAQPVETLAEATSPQTATSWAKHALEQLCQDCPPEVLATLQGQVVTLAEQPQHVADLPPDPKKPQVVRDSVTLAKVAMKIQANADLAIDIETSSLDPRKGEIVGLGIAIADGTFYFPIAHRFAGNGKLLPDQLPLSEIVAALELGERPLIAHNAKFEFRWLRRHAGIDCSFGWDTMIAALLLRSDLTAKLKDVAVRELDAVDWSLPAEEMAHLQFLPIDRIAAYCAADCYYTLELYQKQLERLR